MPITFSNGFLSDLKSTNESSNVVFGDFVGKINVSSSEVLSNYNADKSKYGL